MHNLSTGKRHRPTREKIKFAFKIKASPRPVSKVIHLKTTPKTPR
jgi:hypothetical protein